MSIYIGEIAAIAIPKDLLTATEGFRADWASVLASSGSVELICERIDLHPTQARHLAALLLRAAEKAEDMQLSAAPR